MDILSNSLQIILRTVFSFFVLFLLSRLLGSRSISQLTFYDYIVGITLGDMAASMAIADTLPFYYPLIAIITFALITLLISILTRKSIKLRHFFSGTSTILFYQGKFMYKNMQKKNYDISDLLSECRQNGYFDLNDIEYIIMEMNGEISILPKSEKRPITPKDMQLQPKQELLVANIIIDGNIMQDNLKTVGKEEAWLKRQLEKENISNIKNVVLATCDLNGNFYVYTKKEQKHNFDYFE